MTTRKRNDFLDIASDDDEGSDRGYDSEAAEESKGRFTKRRKTHTRADDLSEESDIGSSGEEEYGSSSKGRVKSKGKIARRGNDDNDDEDEDEDEDLDATESSQPTKPKPLDRIKPKKNKTGVIYLSSVPPYLKPFALKSMLETRGFTPITRVFLTPEVRTSTAAAAKRRSNKRKTYSDGWVEFASKRTAKICAETLNASIVGGRKGSWYHDDVWNMKYLRGFKWADLMEQVQRERSEREASRRIEDMRARKEDRVFLEGVEKGKVVQGIQRKNEEKRKRKVEAGGETQTEDVSELKVRRLFKQNEVRLGRDRIKDDSTLEDDTKRVLSKIF